MRVDDRPVVLNLTEHERLVPDRSLDLVRQRLSGFEWGDTGSGSAQLACGLLLDYYDDEAVAYKHYIQFRDDVVSQLECSGPANYWHLTGDDIEAALAGVTKHEALTPDGGTPTPSLPVNWSAVNRSERTVFQRRDITTSSSVTGPRSGCSCSVRRAIVRIPPRSTSEPFRLRRILLPPCGNSLPKATTSSSRRRMRESRRGATIHDQRLPSKSAMMGAWSLYSLPSWS
nr:DUF6166 domain-containing protein [Haloferax sulfurifontis]